MQMEREIMLKERDNEAKHATRKTGQADTERKGGVQTDTKSRVLSPSSIWMWRKVAADLSPVNPTSEGQNPKARKEQQREQTNRLAFFASRFRHPNSGDAWFLGRFRIISVPWLSV